MLRINIKRKDTGEIINSAEFKTREELESWYNKQSTKENSSFKRYGDFSHEIIDLTQEIANAEMQKENEKKEIKELLKQMTPENRKVIKYILKQLNLKEFDNA